MTTALDHLDGDDKHENVSDESDNEDTVIEDTVIQNNDTYIENLIKSGAPRSSESQTMTISPNFTNYALRQHTQSIGLVNQSHILSPHNSVPYSMKSPKNTSQPDYKPGLNSQPSVDFLLIVENLQKQINQKDQAYTAISKQLKEKQTSFERVRDKNEELQQQIIKLQKEEKEDDKSVQSELIQKSQTLSQQSDKIDELNEKINGQNGEIQQLTKQLEHYQKIGEWVEMQMKWESNGSIEMSSKQQSYGDGLMQLNPKLTIQALEEWKNSIIMNQRKTTKSVDAEYKANEDEKQPEPQPQPQPQYVLTVENSVDSNDNNNNNNNENEENKEEYDETVALLSDNENKGNTDKDEKKKKNSKKKRNNKKIKSQISGEETENQIQAADSAGCCIPWFGNQ